MAYDKVKGILDSSVDGAAFGAHGAFWRNMDREQFVDAVVFGHRLITPGNGRGSNLVKSLLGEPPFGSDLGTPGGTFRRMPPVGWPGVSGEDIGFIVGWIDAGCPEKWSPVPPPAEPKPRRVVVQTAKFAPANVMELVLDDAYGPRVPGTYMDGAWRFAMPAGGGELRFHFLLNGSPMAEPHMVIGVDAEEMLLTERDVSFPAARPRFVHHFEGLAVGNQLFEDRHVHRRLPEGEHVDVIVIGSGMGGGILADATSDLGLKTLVLEAGGVIIPTHANNLPISGGGQFVRSYEHAAGSALEHDVCVNLGGRSVYWSALIPRMRKAELARWPSAVASYLLSGEGYERAEVLLRKQTEFNGFQERLKGELAAEFTDFDVAHLPRSFHQPTSALSRRAGYPDERPTGVFSTAALLINSLAFDGRAGRDNLFVNLHHLVTRIEAKKGSVTGVVCQDLIAGCERRYTANHVVLAAGAIESARITILSGLDNPNGKVGVGVTEHSVAEQVFAIRPGTHGFTANDQAKYILRRTDAACDFTCELALNWKFWDARFEDDDLWVTRYSDRDAINSTVKFSFRSPLDDGNRITVEAGKTRVYVAPLSERPFEAEAMPIKQRVLRFFGVDDQGALDKPLSYKTRSTTLHLGGSLRMDSDGRPGVVDTDLRFHGYDNLWVCDLSVFPDIPAVNPSLTLGALAVRLANGLTARVAGTDGCGARNPGGQPVGHGWR